MSRLASLRRVLGSPGTRRRQVVLAGGIVALVVAVVLVGSSWPLMPDFRDYEAGPARKDAFFGFLRDLVEAENARVMTERRHLEELAAGDELGGLDRWWLERLSTQYRVDPDELETRELLEELLLRVDVVPASLALAQAAKESGWGTSRFARRGHNLFGEWCYTPGCGLVPKRRDEGRRHQVERFASPEQSVASYLRNINTHESYQAFREERARLRRAGQPLSGLGLADALGRYSERRRAYVREVKRMIVANDLEGATRNAGR